MRASDLERALAWVQEIERMDTMLRTRTQATLLVEHRGEVHQIRLPYTHWHAALQAHREGLVTALRSLGVDLER